MHHFIDEETEVLIIRISCKRVEVLSSNASSLTLELTLHFIILSSLIDYKVAENISEFGTT